MRSVLVAAGPWATRVAAVVVLATMGLILPVTPAHAHGQLAMSKPLADTVVNDPLQRLELYFTEAPASNAHFAVTGPSGRVDNGWRSGQPVRLDKPVQEYFLVDGKWEPRVYNTGFPAMVTVAHWPVTGQYVVTYLSVASDGEAVRGSLKFTYNGPVSAAPAGWTPPTNGPAQTLLDQIERAHNAPRAPGAPPGFPGTSPTAGSTGIDDPGSTQTAPASDSGSAVTWLVPAVLVAITAAVIVHAARKPPLPRPARRGRPTSAGSGASRRRGTRTAPGRQRRPTTQ